MKNSIIIAISWVFILLSSTLSFAQDDTDEESQVASIDGKKKFFYAGLYVGSYFANNYTAYNYDGYGYDLGGERNSFFTSFMNTKINIEYGGKNGQPDYIAEALGVQPGEWTFTEADMPQNMRYAISFLIGLNGRLAVSDHGAILVNLNGSKMKVNGNFTINTIPQLNASQLQTTVQTFPIIGGEQRIMIQAGYQHLLGDLEQKINLLIEGGLNVTLSKFDKNFIEINYLLIDLTSYYDPNQPNATATARRPGGTGFGAFAGLGFNVNMNARTQIQMVYNPSYEQIKVETNAPLKWQHAFGLRLYYNL